MPRSKSGGKPRESGEDRGTGPANDGRPAEAIDGVVAAPGGDDGVRLVLPALRAHMGDWIYYLAFMKLRDIAERIQIAEEIHKSERLREMIQREVRRGRAREIRDYLLTRPQRFFSTAVIGVYGGEPRWYELAVRSGPRVSAESLPPYIEGAHGVLELSGTETLFALDGQHRVAGIQLALEEEGTGDLGEEEMSVIFVAHQRTEQGQERTRRLFTTLNRYAKPVSKKEIIALDEDDVVAIITRDLVDTYPLFEGKKTSTTRTASLPANDPHSFTTITTIYDSLDSFLKTRHGWRAFKRQRPSDDKVAEFRENSIQLFDALRIGFPDLEELAGAADDDGIPGRMRRDHGGSLLYRPIGLSLIVKAVRELMDQGMSLAEAVRGVSGAPLKLNEEPWVNLLWDAVNERMLTKGEEQRAALRVLVYGAGGDLEPLGSSEEELRRELAGIKNAPPEAVTLGRFPRSGAKLRRKRR